jgi:hypothetical protein
MSTESDILAALMDRLGLLVLTPPLPVAYPGIDFTAGPNYLRADFLPNQTRQVTIGDDPQQKRGLLQVTVVWVSGEGLIKPLNAAGAVINHFKNLVLWAGATRITVDREPWAASPIQEADRVSIPITIPWHAFEPEV